MIAMWSIKAVALGREDAPMPPSSGRVRQMMWSGARRWRSKRELGAPGAGPLKGEPTGVVEKEPARAGGNPRLISNAHLAPGL
jgi:hypothetical protein